MSGKKRRQSEDAGVGSSNKHEHKKLKTKAKEPSPPTEEESVARASVEAGDKEEGKKKSKATKRKERKLRKEEKASENDASAKAPAAEPAKKPTSKLAKEAKEQTGSPSSTPGPDADGRKAKIQPTRVRYSEAEKSALAESNRAIFVAISQSNTKSGHSKRFAELRKWLSRANIVGKERVGQSGDSYYAVTFETTEQRDVALKDLRGAQFNYEGKTIKLQIQPFGHSGNKGGPVLWTWSAGLLLTHKEVIKEFVDFIETTQPKGWESSVVLAPIEAFEDETGEWVAMFGTAPPNFVKVHETSRKTPWYISQEPRFCRLCNSSGHEMFSCQGGGDRQLSHTVKKALDVKGAAEGEEVSGDKMEE